MAYDALKHWRRKMGLPPPDKICVVCGDSFRPVGGAKTCSPECSQHLRRETAERLQRERDEKRRKETEERQSKAPDKICIVCSTPFRPDGTIRMTCSDACQHVHHARVHNAARQKRREADPEAAREEARQYREANREAVRAYGRQWARKRRAEMRALVRSLPSSPW